MKINSSIYETDKQVFESLIKLGKELPYPYPLSTLDYKALQSKGVCKTTYCRSYNKKEYSEDLVVEFEDGTIITADLISDVYFWELIPPKDSGFSPLTVELPIR